MDIQQHLLRGVTRTNWVLLAGASLLGWVVSPPAFARGILFGGLIVTVGFHMLYRTLKKAFNSPRRASFPAVMARYYARFVVSGVIIFFLISKRIVDPLGLLVGLSVVVASIILTTALSVRRLWDS